MKQEDNEKELRRAEILFLRARALHNLDKQQAEKLRDEAEKIFDRLEKKLEENRHG